MKEKEAKLLVCPFMSTTTTLQSMENGYSIGDFDVSSIQHCITTNCMAWVKTRGDIIDTINITTKEASSFVTQKEMLAHFNITDYEYTPIYGLPSNQYTKRSTESSGYCQRIHSD